MSVAIPTVGNVLVRRYELLQEIGRGGCAVVFEAHDHRLGRAVAVKIPIAVAGDSVKVSRFARESRVIASLNHPNVCAVLDSGHDEAGVPFLVMERLFGESLRSAVARTGPLGLNEALAVGLQLLSALDAVHRAGIVHRDIKPDNILLVARGGCDPIVKLLDFGLCRAASWRRSVEETLTCQGAIVGTPEYMAPEQVLGGALDVRVDLYAAGVVLYEALTASRAFFAKTIPEILHGVMSKHIPPLRRVRRDAPPALESVLRRAMEREPSARFASAAEFQEALNDVRAEISVVARRAHVEAWDPPTTRLVRSTRRPSPTPPSSPDRASHGAVRFPPPTPMRPRYRTGTDG